MKNIQKAGRMQILSVFYFGKEFVCKFSLVFTSGSHEVTAFLYQKG